MTLSSPKHILRQQLLAERQNIALANRRSAAKQASELAVQLIQHVSPSSIVGLYAPFRGELDCFVLADMLRARGYSLALPAITPTAEKPYPMVFRTWVDGASLEQGYAGIAQPQAHAEEVLPDVVIVPLVGFDRQGYRLGYGQGFYDRALPQLRAKQKCCFYGYAFALQEVEAVPHDAHDVPLDGIITEREVIAVYRDAVIK